MGSWPQCPPDPTWTHFSGLTPEALTHCLWADPQGCPTCLLNWTLSWSAFYQIYISWYLALFWPPMKCTHSLGLLTRTTCSFQGQPSVWGQFPNLTSSLRSVSPLPWLAEWCPACSMIGIPVSWCPGPDAQESGRLWQGIHLATQWSRLCLRSIWNDKHRHLSYQVNGLVMSNPLDCPGIDLSQAPLKRLFTAV